MLFTVLNNEKKSFSEYIKKFSLDVVFRTFKYEFYGKDENAFEYENGEIVLFLQGYIDNIVDIHSWLGIKYDPKTSHQADVIVHLYKKFGIEYTLFWHGAGPVPGYKFLARRSIYSIRNLSFGE